MSVLQCANEFPTAATSKCSNTLTLSTLWCVNWLLSTGTVHTPSNGSQTACSRQEVYLSSNQSCLINFVCSGRWYRCMQGGHERGGGGLSANDYCSIHLPYKEMFMLWCGRITNWHATPHSGVQHVVNYKQHFDSAAVKCWWWWWVDGTLLGILKQQLGSTRTDSWELRFPFCRIYRTTTAPQTTGSMLLIRSTIPVLWLRAPATRCKLA